MALIGDILEGRLGTGLALAGGVILAPALLPVVGRLLRPVAKIAIKRGIVLYRQTLAGVGDVAGDLVAEARLELEAESGAQGAARGSPS